MLESKNNRELDDGAQEVPCERCRRRIELENIILREIFGGEEDIAQALNRPAMRTTSEPYKRF